VIVKVDMSDVVSETRDAIKALSHASVERAMFEAVAPFAEQARRSHGYQNRTGYLEASTLVKALDVSDPAVEFVAGPFAPNPKGSMAYASYVNDRGLMNIDDLSARAVPAVKRALEKLVK
jgi:hypothetical protein